IKFFTISRAPFLSTRGVLRYPSHWVGGPALSIRQFGKFLRLAPYGPEQKIQNNGPSSGPSHLRVVGGGCQLSFINGNQWQSNNIDLVVTKRLKQMYRIFLPLAE